MSEGPAQPAVTPRRFFLRRSLAWAIDATLSWIVVAILFAFFAEDRTSEFLSKPEKDYTFGVYFSLGEFSPPIRLAIKTCGAPITLDGFEELVAPAEIASGTACFERHFGIPRGGVVTLVLKDTPAAGELAGQTVEIPLVVTDSHRFADAAALGVFLLGSIFFLRWNGRSPGKAIMGLRVEGEVRRAALSRELVRSFPAFTSVILPLIVTEIAAMSDGPAPWVDSVLLAVGVLSMLGVLVLWIWPVIRWRGAMPYDRWLGLSVSRHGGN